MEPSQHVIREHDIDRQHSSALLVTFGYESSYNQGHSSSLALPTFAVILAFRADPLIYETHVLPRPISLVSLFSLRFGLLFCGGEDARG